MSLSTCIHNALGHTLVVVTTGILTMKHGMSLAAQSQACAKSCSWPRCLHPSPAHHWLTPIVLLPEEGLRGSVPLQGRQATAGHDRTAVIFGTVTIYFCILISSLLTSCAHFKHLWMQQSVMLLQTICSSQPLVPSTQAVFSKPTHISSTANAIFLLLSASPAPSPQSSLTVLVPSSVTQQGNAGAAQGITIKHDN